ncbi:hypothetical protein TSUD_378770 [Trifolium subterraneum]|uniref:Ubiquitin-like protease family profile domain-containing protein n=1 Tax=Trifolium subterraneum TaxID=3900 RepID=A0A2Z6N5I1_TRISU|nr:hypothetical protein TSUD_378770 [Trifolium subterraneum]
MNDMCKHWYLMVVDFVEKKIVWLDSLHYAERDDFRRRAILQMVIILEEILVHKSYNDNITPCSPERMISNFSLCKPRHIQQQRPGSHDYGHITVNTATRMKLAIHLVKSKNNLMYDDVLSKAAAYWREEVHKRDFLVSC